MQVDITTLRESKRPVRPVIEATVVFNELMDSMESVGQLVPILICRGFIVDGHRRLRAAKRLGWPQVETLTRDDMTDEGVLSAQIRLNPDLTIDEARRAIFRLSEENSLDKLSSVGYSLGRNVDWVAEILGLHTLSPVVRQSVDKGLIDIKVATLLAKLPKGRQRTLLTDSIDMPVSELLPQLQQEVKHRWENKLDTRSTKRGRAETPWLRSERYIQNEVETPTDAMRLITKYDAKSPFEGWQLALRWVLQTDPESIKTRNSQIGASE